MAPRTLSSSSGSSNNELYGFSLPNFGFDPSEDRVIRDYYKRKAAKGVLGGPEADEEEVEKDIDQVIAEWEKIEGKKATPQKREEMAWRIRRIREGSWLEGAKTQLVGKQEVPIAWFNRLVAENERTIGFVAQKMTVFVKEKRDMATKIEELNKEINTSKDKRNTAGDKESQAKLDKANKENAAFQDEIAKLKKDLAQCEADAGTGGTRLQDKIDRLESELRAVHQQLRDRTDRVQLLEQNLRETKERENSLKDDARQREKLIADHKNTDIYYREKNAELLKKVAELEKQVESLKLKLSEAESRARISNAGRANPDGSAEPGSGSGTSADPTGATAGDFDAMKLLKDIKEARDNNRDLAPDSNILIERWMQQVADENNLREFWISVNDLRDSLGNVQRRVVDFYHDLGFEAIEPTAEEAIEEITQALKKMPNGDPLMLKLYSLGLIVDKNLESIKTRAEMLKVQNLEMQLDMEKSKGTVQKEVNMQYKIFDEEELEKRVDARTQMFRKHRSDMVDHIFAAYNRLAAISAKCTHEPTREGIQEVRQKYLAPSSLPMPKPQPAR